MDIDNELDRLQRLQRVTPPPFLLTRIEQRIADATAVPASTTFRFALIGTLVVLAAVNIAAVSSFSSRSVAPAGNSRIAEQLQLTTSYDPYE